jgi:hypothetical protein
MPIHPTDRHLNRFADRDLSPGWQALVARHLEGCTRCRARVMAVRALSREAQTLEAPPLPPGLRQRVLAAAASGPAPIIPLADPTPRSRRWQRLAWMSAGAVAIALSLRLVLAPAVLRSEASTLAFLPERPAVGATLEVTYVATPRLAGEERLRLRARYRRVGDPQYGGEIPQVEAAILTRAGDDTFHGMLTLPPDVVYAVFAVEDEAGERVDGRGRLGFELLTYADGQPSYDALVQHAYEAMGRDLGVAHAAMQEATERYPDRVGAWNDRSGLELEALGPAAEDSLRTEYLPRLHAFDAALDGGPVPPDVAESMYFFATRWGAVDVAARWRARLLREAPRSAAALQLRAVDIVLGDGDDPARALAAFEALWTEAGPHRQVVAEHAYAFAGRAGRDDATLRWAARLLDEEPLRRLEVARDLIAIPACRDSVLAWLDEERAALRQPDDTRRVLYRTVPAQRSEDQRALREVLALMGRAHLAAGDLAASIALLDSATERGWSLAHFETLADARLTAGDLPRGIDMLARLAVDPAYDGPDPAARALALVPQDEWERATHRAERYMLDETLGEADAIPLPASVRVADPDGTERDLRPLIEGQITVVAVFWPGCRACYADLRRLELAVGRLPQPAGVILVSTTEISAEQLAALRAADVSLPVTVDARGEFTAAVGSWGTTEYYVIDARGVVRFGDTTLEDIPREVLALQDSGVSIASSPATDVAGPAGAPVAYTAAGSR